MTGTSDVGGFVLECREHQTAPTVIIMSRNDCGRLAAAVDPSGSANLKLHPDVVLCATGYRRGLELVVGHLGVLDERGVPVAPCGESVADGLRFLGFSPRP